MDGADIGTANEQHPKIYKKMMNISVRTSGGMVVGAQFSVG